MQQSQVPHLGGLLQRLRAEREDEKHGNDSLAKRIPTTSLPVSRRKDSGPWVMLPGPASPLKKDYANDYDNSTRGTLTKGLQLNLEADNVQWLNDDVEDSDPDVFGQELLELETLVTDTIRDPFQELFREQDLVLQNERSVSSLNNTASSTTRNYRRATKKLNYEKYAVGWICALPVEMAAAKAMLDEIHIPLPNPRGDNNAYQLGSIGRHNIVITCIRSGVYGTTSATAAAITMRSTYPNSSLAPLMVGIGGGVPRPDTNDIRLGDVVISTPTSEYPAVVQYDYGKATQEGVLEHKGSLNKPAPILLSTLSHFRSQLAPHSVQVSKHIVDAQYRSSLDGGMFLRPDPQTDFLSAKECNSHESGPSCLDCPTGRVDRKARNHRYPEIHYGSIASGNQVIKNAGIRDLIATRFGILCFEMEAAGVMDYLPCLVIRGVSDYCDAQKNKEWQSYAAVAAAAVAKELLSYIPFLELGTSDTDLGEHQKLLDALDFEDSNTRRATVKRPHSRTCRWLLQQQQLLDWLDPKKYQQHHGMLWIKGKPGTGKSTIMKYLTDHTETLYNDSKFISVVSYFFNARGPELGRSTIGMYRSLLVQIFGKMPSLQSLVDHKRLRIASVESFVWTTEALQDILREVVNFLDRMQLICFIDALDECPEDQVRDMVDFLEELSQLAAPNHLHICLSSRHYPHISIKKGCEFVLETQEGHTTDILNYLDAELVLGRNRLASELKKKAYAKSGGIFLWIVLVVQILKREYDRGGIHKLMGILNKIPTQVDDLFRDMLTRDSVNLPQLIASIRWVLYAQRPLKVDEFYYAMLSSESIFDVTTHRDDEICYEDMHRYMLSCSKGIVETTTAVDPTVQFIHETVREFLLQPAVLEGLWPGFEGISEGPSHEILKQCCFRHLKQLESKGFRASVARKAKVLTRNLAHAFPFSRYAVGHILDHADKAERCKISQTDFLEEFESTHWSYYKDLISSVAPKDSEDFGCALAINNRQDLFKCWLEKAKNSLHWPDLESSLMLQLLLDNNISAFKEVIAVGHPTNLKTASLSRNVGVIFSLLQRMPLEDLLRKDHKLELMASILRVNGRVSADQLHKALVCAAYSGTPEAVKLFLGFGAAVNTQNAMGISAIHRTIEGAQSRRTADAWIPAMQCIRLLLDQGADVNAEDTHGRTPLHVAAEVGSDPIVRMLVRNGASINVQGDEVGTPLTIAIRSKNYRVVQTLLDRGAFVVIDHLSLCLEWSPLRKKKEAAREILSQYLAGNTAGAISALEGHCTEVQLPLAKRLFVTHQKQSFGPSLQ